MFDDLVEPCGAVEEVVGAAEEAGGAEGGAVVGGCFVGGEHVGDHAVEAGVGVEGFDDPVAPVPDVFLAVAELGVEAPPIAVAPEVHEVAGPAFAELGGGEELVDDGGAGVGRGIGEERGGEGGGGWETGEVEGDAAEPEGGWGWGLRGDGGGGVASGEGLVDEGEIPVREGGGWWVGGGGWLEGPVGARVRFGVVVGGCGGTGGEP